MKYPRVILASLASASLTALLVLLRHELGGARTVLTLAYGAVPLGLGALLAWTNEDKTDAFRKMLIATITYSTVVSFLEPVAYRFWDTALTPAGYAYSSYDLHALFPLPGILFLPAAFAAVLLISLIWTAIRSIAHAVNRSFQRQ